jgi:hypothetical protein
MDNHGRWNSKLKINMLENLELQKMFRYVTFYSCCYPPPDTDAKTMARVRKDEREHKKRK